MSGAFVTYRDIQRCQSESFARALASGKENVKLCFSVNVFNVFEKQYYVWYVNERIYYVYKTSTDARITFVFKKRFLDDHPNTDKNAVEELITGTEKCVKPFDKTNSPGKFMKSAQKNYYKK